MQDWWMRAAIGLVMLSGIMGLSAAVAVGEEPATPQTPAPAASATLSGELLKVDVGGLSPSVTVKVGEGQVAVVSVDRYNTTVSGLGHDGLSDLKVGQQVSITGRIMPALDRLLTKTITVTSDAPPPSTAASSTTTSSGAAEKPKTGPTVLRSIPKSETP
jgi:hypothetical protein